MSAAAPRWLAILGIGEDGVEGLSPAARALLAGAELVVGGARHLALAAALIRGEALAWARPLTDSFPALLARRGRPVAVLASGDPYCYGVGGLLAAVVPAAETIALPAPSAFSLAAARLGWALQDVATVSCCGRPVASLLPLLQPGRRLLVLSADGGTPCEIASLLRAQGFGPTCLTVLEALGGPRERLHATTAAAATGQQYAPLNLVALALQAEPGARVIPRAAGLPEEMFEHDGQITKREVRAMTLASLAPRRGETLWDIGSGSGSVAIEWMLCDPANRAVGVEMRPERAARAARNALALGVPGLALRIGRAPSCLDGLPPPDAVFLGGGAHEPGLVERAWAALPPGGRLVANGVTVETEAALLAARRRYGGQLVRLSVERLDALGGMHGFRPAMTVTQWAVARP